MAWFQTLSAGGWLAPSSWIGAIMYGGLFLAGAWLSSRLLQRFVNRLLAQNPHMSRTSASFALQLGRLFLFILAGILYAHLIPALQALGTALLAGVSVASVVVGLAAQSTLSNLIAGFSLALYRPFELGDRVQINAPTGLETGTVERLTLGYTLLKTYDNRRIVVPNSVMATQITVNLTTEDQRVLASIPIGISYEADLSRARALLLELARNHPHVQEVVGCPVIQLGPSSVVLSLQAWCPDAGQAKQVEYDIYEQVKEQFAAAGIEIPYPYTNVVLKSKDAG